MGREWIGAGLAFMLVVGCSGRDGAADKDAARAAQPPSKSGAPPEKALTFSYPGEAWRQWVAISLPDGGDDQDDEMSDTPPIYRLRGDGFSRYYYIERGEVSDVRDEEGRLLAHIPRSADNLGLRKTAARTAIFLYYQPEDHPQHYDLVTIEGGAAKVYRCSIDRATFEAAAGRHFATGAMLLKEAYRYSNLMVNELQEHEPALARDHCAAIDDGVKTSGEPLIRPVLRLPVPHVGDVLALDDRGFKGGWIYGGGMSYGPGRRTCCYAQYEGEGRDLFVIANPLTKDPTDAKVHISQIVYVEKGARSSYDCEIDGAAAITAVADADWKNGRAYLIEDGKTRIVRWSDKAPTGCVAQ